MKPPEQQKKGRMIYVDDATIERARIIGYGNYSLGFRIAVMKCPPPITEPEHKDVAKISVKD